MSGSLLSAEANKTVKFAVVSQQGKTTARSFLLERQWLCAVRQEGFLVENKRDLKPPQTARAGGGLFRN